MTTNRLTLVLADEERLRRGLQDVGAPVVVFGSVLRAANDDARSRRLPYLAAFARAHGDRFGCFDALLVSASAVAFAASASRKGVERLLCDVVAARGGALEDTSVLDCVFGGAVDLSEANAFCGAVQRALSGSLELTATNFEEGDLT